MVSAWKIFLQRWGEGDMPVKNVIIYRCDFKALKISYDSYFASKCRCREFQQS